MLRQSLQQKLQQKLSPQQIQLMKLIQLPTQAFEQKLAQEIEENPALESGKEETDEFADNHLLTGSKAGTILSVLDAGASAVIAKPSTDLPP